MPVSYQIFSLNKIDDVGYSSENPQLTTYELPIVIYAEGKPPFAGSINQQDEYAEAKIYATLDYTFARYDSTTNTFVNFIDVPAVEEESITDIEEPYITLENQIMFGSTQVESALGQGGIDPSQQRFEVPTNLNINSPDDILQYLGYSADDRQGMELINCKIKKLFWQGQSNKVMIRIQIGDDKFPTIEDKNSNEFLESVFGLDNNSNGPFNNLNEYPEDYDDVFRIKPQYNFNTNANVLPVKVKMKLSIQNLTLRTLSNSFLQDTEQQENQQTSTEEEFVDTSDPSLLDFNEEQISLNFGVLNGEIPEQTLLNPIDPYSGMEINLITDNNLPIFQNTQQGLIDSDQDGRIALGMFSFIEENISENNFPDILSTPFSKYVKTNLVKNGDCKFVRQVFVTGSNNNPLIVEPDGGWRFLSLFDNESYTSDDSGGLNYENYSIDNYQNFQPYGGRYAYVPLNIDIHDGGLQIYKNLDTIPGYVSPLFYSGEFPYYDGQNQKARNQDDIDNALDYNNLNTLRSLYQPKFQIKGISDTNNSIQDFPHVAQWSITDEAYSHNRCLQFINFQVFDNDYILNYLILDGVTNTTYPYGYAKDSQYVFNYLLVSDYHIKGEIKEVLDVLDNPNAVYPFNQYRVLNQVQKIYDKFDDERINPYSSLKIRFKMKTTHVLPPGNSIDDEEDENTFKENPLDESLGYAPQVEIGVLNSQFHEIPKSGVNGIGNTDGQYDHDGKDIFFESPGGFNSLRYTNTYVFENQSNSRVGGMTRFQNSVMNEWETFEFNYNLTEQNLNRGYIYGVPYGGIFNDELNNGPVEIMINHQYDTGDNAPQESIGDIFFKMNGYQNEPGNGLQSSLNMIHPKTGEQVNWSIQTITETNNNYMTVKSGMGIGPATGEESGGNGLNLEAYLMYVSDEQRDENNNIISSGYIDGALNSDDTKRTNVTVAWWNGQQWFVDQGGSGYNAQNKFTPDNKAFILGRLYGGVLDETFKILNIDQYISNETQFPTDGVGNLHLFLQSGNNFQGRVLIDDIECYESYEFIPEVDVRKKISVDNFGKADLTKYYDSIIHGPNGTNEYKDSTAPLEAQFYFYPQYPTNETFVQRTPIYQDFKLGRFYIYDVDWGDGSPNEFLTPEQIDENTALYHTYETHGIFEITGMMLRIKVDENDEIQGVIYNKKFNLRININEGLEEDFEYFGSNGYSFLPFKNTTPIIGGISKQSSYYKKIKRQLGFLNKKQQTPQYFIDNPNEFPVYFQEFDYDGNGTLNEDDAQEFGLAGRIDIENYIMSLVDTNTTNTLPNVEDGEKINIDFKNDSDKLKTELALLKMDKNVEQNLNILPNYLLERFLPSITTTESPPEDSSFLTTLPFPTNLEEFGYSTILDENGNSNYIYLKNYWETNGRPDIAGLIDIFDDAPPVSGSINNQPSPYSYYQLSGPLLTYTYPSWVMEYVNPPSFYVDSGQILELEQFGVQYLSGDFTIPEPNQDSTPNPVDYYHNNPVTTTIEGDKIYNGITPIKEELGKGIGDCDLTCIKYYNEPKSIWEMFGFEENDLNIIGKPDEPRYWKNIIPKDFSIFNRFGVNIPDISRERLSSLPFPQYFEEFNINNDINIDGLDGAGWVLPDGVGLGVGAFRPDIGALIGNVLAGNEPSTDYDYPSYVYDWSSVYDIPVGNGLQQPIENFFNPTNINIDIYSEQNWITPSNLINDYYYPVLPRYNAGGNFIEGDFPNNKIPFPLEATITNENESNENLIINIINDKLESDILQDKSGNDNLGFGINDFSPKFDNETLRVEKSKPRSIFRTSKENGAF